MIHSEDVQLTRLREAAGIGIADIDAGRYQVFNTPAALAAHLRELLEWLQSERGNGGTREA